MAVSAEYIRGSVFVGGTVTLLARIEDQDGTEVTQAAISSGKYYVYLLDNDDPARAERHPVANHDGVALTIANVIYDTLQTGDPWDEDSIGFNVKYTIDVSTNACFQLAGRMYLVEVRLTPDSGQIITAKWLLRCM